VPETPKRLRREPETQQPPRWFVGYRAAASGFPRSSASRGLRKAHRACCKVWVPAVRSLGRHVAKHFASGVETERRVGKEVVNELKTWLGGFDKRATAKRARNREGRARHRRDRRFQTESRFAPAESFREKCLLHKVRRGSEHDKCEQPRCVRFRNARFRLPGHPMRRHTWAPTRSTVSRSHRAASQASFHTRALLRSLLRVTLRVQDQAMRSKIRESRVARKMGHSSEDDGTS